MNTLPHTETLPLSLYFVETYINNCLIDNFNPSDLVRHLNDEGEISIEDQKQYIRWMATKGKTFSDYKKIEQLKLLRNNFKPYTPSSLKDFIDIYLSVTTGDNALLLSAIFGASIRFDKELDNKEKQLIIDISQYLMQQIDFINNNIDLEKSKKVKEKLKYNPYVVIIAGLGINFQASLNAEEKDIFTKLSLYQRY